MNKYLILAVIISAPLAVMLITLGYVAEVVYELIIN
jgi:uncharacterized membrane protein